MRKLLLLLIVGMSLMGMGTTAFATDGCTDPTATGTGTAWYFFAGYNDEYAELIMSQLIGTFTPHPGFHYDETCREFKDVTASAARDSCAASLLACPESSCTMAGITSGPATFTGSYVNKMAPSGIDVRLTATVTCTMDCVPLDQPIN